MCLPRPFTNFGTSVCVAVGLLEYSHAKKCNFFKTLRFLFFPCVFGIWTIKQKLPEIQFYLLGLVFNAQIQSWSNVFFKNFLWGYFWPKQKSHDFFFWFSLNFPKPKFQNLLHPFKNGSDGQECITDLWSYFVYLLSSLSPVCTAGIFCWSVFNNHRCCAFMSLLQLFGIIWTYHTKVLCP